MRKIFKFVFCIGLICVFYSCSYGEWNITLYVQKIEGTTKALYKYDAWGGRDSHLSGYTILDTTETFEISKRKELPISYLLEIPRKNLIFATEETYESGDSFNPIDRYIINEQGIEIQIKKYTNFSEKSWLRGQFVFGSFKETRDSLFFYNLDDTISMNPEHINCLKLKKINVYVSQDKNKQVSQITIDDIELSKDTIISQKTYFLNPKTRLTLDNFSDYGIFKEKE